MHEVLNSDPENPHKSMGVATDIYTCLVPSVLGMWVRKEGGKALKLLTINLANVW